MICMASRINKPETPPARACVDKAEAGQHKAVFLNGLRPYVGRLVTNHLPASSVLRFYTDLTCVFDVLFVVL